MFTFSIAYLATNKLPVVAAKSTLSLLFLDRYLLPLASLNRYIYPDVVRVMKLLLDFVMIH